MTVIAWDGRTLAADKQATNGSTKKATTKIFRHGAELLAVSGDHAEAMAALRWYQQGGCRDGEPWPEFLKGKDGFGLIVIQADRKVWRYEGPVPFSIEGQFCAFGSGDEAALVAMACGKTAAEAVGLACMYNTGCGMGIDTLQLEEPATEPPQENRQRSVQPATYRMNRS